MSLAALKLKIPSIYVFHGCFYGYYESIRPKNHLWMWRFQKMLNMLLEKGFLDYEDILQVCYLNPLRLIRIDPEILPGDPLIDYDAKNKKFSCIQKGKL